MNRQETLQQMIKAHDAIKGNNANARRRRVELFTEIAKLTNELNAEKNYTSTSWIPTYREGML